MELHHLIHLREITLVAIDHTRNCRRHYRISRSRDLFGQEIIELAWGRIGARGQSRTVSAPPGNQADRIVAKILNRRATACKRIGVAYRINNSG
ncbi:WGR domain-containing protein [Croceicoccus sp. F390]|uniref:WGR domain-containing protein n=1 Tax=Croceicoccus esteveae TaxID=3075597 RepID=A0ABU2ZKS8_9SPHN|nr:WGR domain-containing protein [Croceicoccus sp. F390]MDT0576990.1 WGR domain-containing protein [Croceicoccus sp. F390]